MCVCVRLKIAAFGEHVSGVVQRTARCKEQVK